MSDLHFIEKVQDESNSRKTSSFVQHHVKKKLIRSIGNFNTNGASLNTTTATSSSSAKFSVTSTTEGKSVVSSLSMSLERKDSIQYIPRKIATCVIPAGQNTVIHLDNYAHFMAQRFTTTKAAIKREEIITEGHQNQIIVPAPTSNTSKSRGIVDVNLKVLSGGATSSYHNNNKAIVMNKQKLLDKKSLKIRGLKNSLALELKLPKEIKKVNNIMADKTVTTPILKKPKVNRRQKVVKPRSSKKIKIKTGVDQDNINKEELEKSILPIKQPSNTSKELRPCMFTLQRKKCLSEMTCPYLHSDFPCKYYYLNLICPQGFKCQFMHNGPLEPKLIEALRNHILDLLSTKPSSVETLFVQQIHNIEDLAQRLQSFQTNQEENHEVIEVVDDEDDEQELVIDESSNEIKTNHLPNTTSKNAIFNTSQANDQTLALQPTEDKLDLVYENFKDTNTIIDEIDQKLKHIKSTSNMTTNERIYHLQNIYKLIKEQETRLPNYKHFSTAPTTKQTSTNKDNSQHFSNSLPTIQSEEPHIVLVNPDIINEIQTSDSQENAVMSISDDDNTMTIADHDRIQLTNFNIPQESGIEYPTIEELPPQGGIEILTNKHSQQQATDDNNESMSLSKESDINEFNISSNFDYEADPKTCLETILDNSHLNKNSYEEPKENNENFQNLNKKISYENEEILVKNNSQVSDKTENVEEKVEFIKRLLPYNGTLELEITNGEKEIIESHVEMQLLNEDDVEEQSPSYEYITAAKPKERSRLRLRSHTLQNNDEVNNNENSPATSLETKKPIRNRRLRLPKPCQKTAEKSNNEIFEINGQVINNPFQSTENTVENTENKKKEITVIQDVEVPLTQNVIVTKRFLKRAKAKQSLLNEETNKNATMDANVEQSIMALHCEDHENIDSIENINVTLLTQTSDDTNSLNQSQDPLILESDCESIEKINNEIMSGQCFDNRKTSNKIKRKTSSNNLNLQTDMEKWEAVQKPNSKRRISFENPLPLLNTTSVKEQFNLGNPHVVLAKLKPQFLLPSSQKEILADTSTKTNVNSIVTSPLLADDKPAQKRHSFTSEYDLDSSLKENKCLKIDNNSKSMRRVKIDNRKRTTSQQSSDSKDGDFDVDSCDEKLTIVDVIQISSPSTGSEQKTVFEPFSTHVKSYQKQQQYSHSPQHVHKEQQQQQQQANESDLSQQIENISNKSDLQLQTQQQQRFVQREEVGETTTTTSTSFITKNSKNIPNEQHQQEEESQNKLVCQKQYENNKKMGVDIANTCNPYGDNKKVEDGRVQSPAFERIHKDKEATSNSSNKYSNETTLKEMEINEEYSTFSSLYNKLSAHSKKCEINFENCSVNITPISSPTYNNDTIASPSPVRKLIDFRMGGEIDGRLTNPPIPYILHEVDLGRIQPYKKICVNKLKTQIQMDPRMLRTYVKKQFTSTSTALVPISSSNNLSHHIGDSSSSNAQPTSTFSPYDPRNRASAVMRDIATPSLSHHHETALTPYNNLNVASSSSTLPSSLMYTVLPNAVPLSLQYNSSAQPIIQPQQQQTPNMFLYGCLQRSPWYQGLMSTMKIQINQSISQLVRALNNFHRERLLSPEMVFDVFKIDCAGELLEIMRNLGIFVDANGIINEQRKVPSFGGRSCCNSMPVNATYSFIQQVLTPNTQCTSLTTASSTYNAAGGTPVGQLNVNEPFVSCYIKAPEQPTQKQSDDNNNTLSNHSQHDDNSGNRRCNGNCNSNRNDNYNNNNNNTNYNNKRFGNQYKKPFDNNNGNSNYQQRSNQRSSYNNNNPRFNKPGSGSPNRSNSSPPNSPRNGGGGRGGGGRFNNNRRFNNYNNNDNNFNNNNGSSWSSSSGSNDNRFNKKYQNNNSPTSNSSPKSSFQTGSPKASSPQPAFQNSGCKPDKKASTDEECWDSDN